MSFASRRGQSRTRRPPHVGIAFHHAPAFWAGTPAMAIGVVLHLPTFFSAASMGYRLVGMPMSNEMLAGMALIVQRASVSFLEMRALMILAVIAGALFSHTPVEAQTTTAPGAGRPTPIREVLASRGLSTVVDAPLYFRLLRVTLPAGQSTGYAGPHGFVYGLSGGLAVASNGGPATLRGGEAVFVDAGRPVTLRAMEGESAVFLHFLLVRAAELNSSTEGRPAAVTELYRTAAPIPGLKPGPYEFSLTRVTFPPQFPINPPHRRSGAALYYIPSGTGAITTGGRTEPRPAGSIQYEPNDFVHQWANPGDTPLVLLQANISPEGTPVVIFER